MYRTLMGLTANFLPILSDEDFQAVKDAREGSVIEFPASSTRRLSNIFENSAQFASHHKFMTVAEHAALTAGVGVLFAAAPSTPIGLIVPTAFAIGSAYLSARTGARIVKIADNVIENEINSHEVRANLYVRSMKGIASDHATSRFVTDMNDRVNNGQRLSLQQLGKLVHIEIQFFGSANDKLAITVLQAKLMIAMQNKQIEEMDIPHSSEVSTKAANPDEYLVSILWSAFNKAAIIDDNYTVDFLDLKSFSTENKQRDTAQTPPSSNSEKSLLGLGATYFWNCVKGNARVFQKPRAADYIDTLPSTFTVDEFESVPDLAERIELFGAHKLDLPALTR